MGISKNQSKLVEKFLKSADIASLWPPVTSCCILVQTVTVFYKKALQELFRDKSNLDVLLIHKDGKTSMYLDSFKLNHLCIEFFSDYLHDQATVVKKIKIFEDKKAEIRTRYLSTTYKYLRSLKDIELDDLAKTVCADLATADGIGLFSLTFDKELLQKMLATEKIDLAISDDFIIRSIDIPILSFDAKQEYEFFEYIKKAESENLKEACQYFFASYSMIYPADKIEALLKKRFGVWNKEIAKERLDNIRKELTEKKRSYELWLESLTDPMEKILAKYIATLVEVRDERKAPIAMSYTLLYRIVEEIFRRHSLPAKQILNVSADEILKGSQYIKEHFSDIERRDDGTVIFVGFNEEKTEMEYGEEYFKSAEKRMQEIYQPKVETKIIKGITGSRGQVQGRVRVINFFNTEQHLFREGEILVTGMTRPEYVPLMKKALAIITDEGGLSCHAAIIARELKKPCIIGTKNATRILKDGDLVEVDADAGVVRIIK